jgi:DNA-binding XRE family transcriptional regulator
MNRPGQLADLSNRRRRLGASRETMAAGLGLSVDTVKAIEDGAASDPEHELYNDWLGRIEGWPADVRARQFLAAGKGGRFDAESGN